MLDTGFAPCYTRYNMVQWRGEPLECRSGDIVIEMIPGQKPSYWVVTKVIENSNPIRFGHTYKEMYDVFNLENDMECVYNVMFRNANDRTYEIIRG